MIDIGKAMAVLLPDSLWVCMEDTYETLEMLDGTKKPSLEELDEAWKGILIQQAKSSKLQQIENDYISSEEQTVEVSGVIYSGGTSSVEAIDSYVRLNRLAGNTNHSIWDVNGTEHTLTDSEVDSVILAIGVQASTNKFTKKNRKVALAVATTIAEVEAI